MTLVVNGLHKSFRKYKNFKNRFLSWMGIGGAVEKQTYVLRNVSFKLSEGESVGLIGPNGAGKSTLLKIIAGIVKPTDGNCEISGVMSSILELGVGFNHELTGRQNAYHVGALMGLSNASIAEGINDISTFAELKEYFDEPVRTYSTGMQMRLAFAIAVFRRPNLLLVDEAFAVGDSYFQHKSIQKIREFNQKGTSLLLVSHDRNALQTLCSRALLLWDGEIIMDGKPEEVCDYYSALISKKSETFRLNSLKLDGGKMQISSGTREAIINSVSLLDVDGNSIDEAIVGASVKLCIQAKVLADIERLVCGFSVRDRLGRTIFGTNTWHTDQVIIEPNSGDIYQFIFEFPLNFGVGSYSIQVALVDSDTHLSANYEWNDIALMFHVSSGGEAYFEGCAWVSPKISIELLAV